MRNRVSAYRSRYLRQAALIAVVAVVAAACNDVSRFDTPVFTGSTENQREIIGNDQPMPPPVSGATVAQYDLPPVAPQAAPPAASNSTTPVFALPAGSYQWTPEGVKPVGVVQAASYTPPPVAQSTENVHIVAAGETLYSIGRLYRVRPNDIAALNTLSSPGQIRVGQRLQIPGAGSQAIARAEPVSRTVVSNVVAATAPAEAILARPSSTSRPAAANTAPRIISGVPAIPVETKATTLPAIPASTVASVDAVIEPPSTNGTSFRWPVRGRIISDFGVKPSGQRNDGINLAVPAGTTVKAAEAGSVIYAGNELDGYGNLVLIQHADDWVSAYAHNGDIRVRRGDQIRRGQTVATAGMSGSVASPQVHFELRKKAKPVNPLDYLAGA